MTSRIIFSMCTFLGLAVAATGQQQELSSQPTKEHQWLEQFVGEWQSTSEIPTVPGQPPMKCEGQAKVRMLGKLWLISETEGDMMGTKVLAVQTIGYDPEKKKYVGTWVDSMMNHMWHYEGHVDESGKKLILEAEGPNFIGDGKIAKFRDAYEFKSPDHIEATSSMQGEDGKWVQFMTGQMRRKQ